LENSRWRTATILQIVKLATKKSSAFDEICYTDAGLQLDDSQMTKYDQFHNLRGSTGAILKIAFGQNSSADCRFQ